jgi:A/G-specific adenine glycosylase
LPRFATRLLQWYDRERRDLPWRRTRDPWLIWVSEVMLQQTRVEAVRAAFVRFAADYPTPAAFADAGDDEVQAAWRGLGYYRRARLLRDGARAVAALHAGRVPDDAATLLTLPGIGEYTRGAIASIAFDQPLPAIDGNVERVMARHRGISTPIRSADARRQIAAAVAARQDRRRPGDFNQALMELGAVVCLPKAPRCGLCPVAAGCRARRSGRQESLPSLRPRPASVLVAARVLLAPAGRGEVLARRIAEGEVNAGQLDLVGLGALTDVADVGEFVQRLRRTFRSRFRVGDELGSVRHSITRHRVVLRVHAGECTRRAPRELVAARPDDAGVPWSTLSRKVFDRVAAARPLSSPALLSPSPTGGRG